MMQQIRVRAPDATPKRCFDIGAFDGKCVERWPENKRVPILGTGGLSHWTGHLQTGRVNERLERGEIPEVTTRNARYEDLEAVAGNGGHGIRDWLAVAGAMPPRLRPHVLTHEPLKIMVDHCRHHGVVGRLSFGNPAMVRFILNLSCGGELAITSPEPVW
jgi:hypothetical protein